MKTEQMKVSAIKGNPDNPRIIKDEAFAKLVKSIQDFPQMLEIRPIVINKEKIILGGNMRWKAATEAGLKTVPCIKVNLTPEQEKEFIIKDNVSGGEWDWQKIYSEWADVPLSDWGLKTHDLGQQDNLSMVNNVDDTEWVGMPDFESVNSPLKIIVSFENETDREEFLKLHPMDFVKKQEKTWMTWFPFKERQDLKSLKYEQ